MARIKQIAKANGWNFDKAVAETERKINGLLTTSYCTWSRKNKLIDVSPVQMHEQSEKPNVIEVSKRQIVYLFGLKKELQIRHQGLISTEIQKEKFIYQIEDFDIIKRYGSVLCCYDVEDLSEVHLFAPGQQALKAYLGVAKEFIPIQNFGPDAERGRMAKVVAMYKAFESERVAELQSKLVANGENFLMDYEEVIQAPMLVSKRVAEIAEQAFDNRKLTGIDEGETINHNNIKDL